jgi:hypothetical protein
MDLAFKIEGSGVVGGLRIWALHAPQASSPPLTSLNPRIFQLKSTVPDIFQLKSTALETFQLKTTSPDS